MPMTTEEAYRLDWMTDQQWACAELVADVFGGHHHMKSPKPAGRGIRVIHQGHISTFDNSCLTRLVVLAHERAIRVDIQPAGPRNIAIVAHHRGRREGLMHERHPSIEQVLEDRKARA